jgi:hypothetical protein
MRKANADATTATPATQARDIMANFTARSKPPNAE